MFSQVKIKSVLVVVLSITFGGYVGLQNSSNKLQQTKDALFDMTLKSIDQNLTIVSMIESGCVENTKR